MRTLFIIGNGFDLGHHLPTNYSDFKNYLVSHDNEYYEQFAFLRKNFDNNENTGLWSSFEETLGKASIGSLAKEEANHEFHSYADDSWSDAYHHSYQDSIKEQLSFSRELSNKFLSWIKTINLKNYSIESYVKHDLIKTNDYYLTFNYTDVLEEKYHIQNDNIIHIHGRAKTNEKLIVGHNSEVKHRKYTEDEDPRIIEGEEEIEQYYLSTYKNPIQNIECHKDKLLHFIKNSDQVIVLGHSILKSQIDLEYFKFIQSSNKHLKWTIYDWKNSLECLDNEENLNNFKNTLLLNDVKLVVYDNSGKEKILTT